MAYTVKITTTQPFINIGETAIVTATVSQLASDPVLDDKAVATLSLDSTSTGNVEGPASSKNPPFKMTMGTPSSSGATYTFPIKGTVAGPIKFTVAITTPAVSGSSDTPFVVIDPATKYIAEPTFSRRAMMVHTDDTLTPSTAPDKKKSTLTITATEPDGSAAANVPVAFYFRNINSNSDNIGGKYYNDAGAQITFTTTANNGRANSSITTNAQGSATLTVVPNTRSAFVRLTLSSGIQGQFAKNLYLYDTSTNSNLDNLELQLNTKDGIIWELEDENSKTFDVSVPANPDKGEFVALILNGEFQDEKPAASFSTGFATFSANTKDLIFSTDPKQQNEIFYTVSKNLTLSNSKRMLFNIDGTNPNFGPTPVDGFVGPISNLNDQGVINNNDVFSDLPIVIPFKDDRDKIAGRSLPAITTTNVVKIFLNMQGDNPSNVFSQGNKTYIVPITDIGLDTIKFTIPGPDLSGFDTPADPKKKNIYQLWYAYMDSATGNKRLAESIMLTGPIHTVRS